MDYADTYVNVVLRDVNHGESLPVRHFPVASTWSFKIGRGSQNEADMNPEPHNSLFGSRVMSREHAEVFIDQATRVIEISDLSSMHGTYLHGRKLRPGEKTKLLAKDIVTFGSDVVRGEYTYRPLSLEFDFEWSDDAEIAEIGLAGPSTAKSSIKQFSLARSDEDDEDIILASSSSHRSKPDTKARTFSVPDFSDSESELDENPEHSSPITFDEDDREEIVGMPTLPKDTDIGLPKIAKSPFEQSSQVIVIDAEQPNLPKNNSVIDKEIQIGSRSSQTIQASQMAFSISDDEKDDEDSNDEEYNGEAQSGMDDQSIRSDSEDYVDDSRSHIIEEDPADLIDDEILEPAAIFLQGQSAAPTLNKDEQATTSFGEHPVIGLQSTFTTWANADHVDNNATSNRSFTGTLAAVDHFDLPEPRKTLLSDTYTDLQPGSSLAQEIHQSIPQKSERLSIYDIINDTDSVPQTRPKRKAPEMCDPKFNGPESDILSARISPHQSQVVVKDAVKHENESLEPPQKKIKTEIKPTNEKPRGNTFLKYTATAVVGAAVGAVTAVIGLAALPADYFI